MGQQQIGSDPPLDTTANDKDTFYWVNARNERMFARLYRSDTTADLKGIIFQFHGLHGHGNSKPNIELCHGLSKAGFVVIALDQTGHGRSATPETRGQIANWLYLRDDGVSFVDMVMSTNILDEFMIDRSLPFFLMGASMGGCVALHVSLQLEKKKTFNNFGGTILMAPLIYNLVTQDIGAVTVTALKAVHSIGLGSLALGPEPRQENFSSLEVWQKFKSDTLIYSGKMRLSTGANMLDMATATQQILDKPEFPFLVMHGDQDTIVDIKGSIDLFEKSKTSSQKKQIIIYPDASHALVEDVGDVLWNDILSWIEKRFGEK